MKEDHWATLLRARAIENTCYVVAAAQTGSTYAGASMVVDPMGVRAAALGDEVGIALADLDPNAVERGTPDQPFACKTGADSSTAGMR